RRRLPRAAVTHPAGQVPRGGCAVKTTVLSALLARVGTVVPLDTSGLTGAALDAPVTGIAYDSRSVSPGQVFVALQGVKDDGTRYAAEAVARGAIAVVGAQVPEGLPAVITANGRT